MKMRVKPWERVEIGMWGENYNGERGRVVGKGKGRENWEELRKWDNSGVMSDFMSNLDLYGYTEEDLEVLEMVAVREEDGCMSVYNYGEDGFCVMESVYVENLRKVLEK